MLKSGAAFLLSLAAAAGATELRVPSQYPTIKAAIVAAAPGDTVTIADGVYTGTGNVGLNFGGKAITVKSERGPQACIIDAAHSSVIVTFNMGEGAGSVLEGLTLRRGNGTEGGGAQCSGASPTIRGCIFESGRAGYHSSGVGCINGSSPRIEDCRFIDGLAGVGGAVNALSGSHPRLIGCTITGHRTDLFGAAGAGCDATSSLTIDRCTFSGNTAVGFSPYGGAIHTAGGTATITNSLFMNNTAGYGGGAISCSNGATLRVINCTFVGNTAGSGGGGAIWSQNASPAVANSILWGNSPDQVAAASTASVSYSVVAGGWPGAGNISADPMFVSPGGDFRPAPGSPCIDAGNSGALPAGVLLDLGALPRRVDDPATPDTGLGSPVVDIGAHEFQVTGCYANCDGSGVPPLLNVVDFICFQSRFAAADPYANCDGSAVPPVLNVADFICFMGKYAAGCP